MVYIRKQIFLLSEKDLFMSYLCRMLKCSCVAASSTLRAPSVFGRRNLKQKHKLHNRQPTSDWRMIRSMEDPPRKKNTNLKALPWNYFCAKKRLARDAHHSGPLRCSKDFYIISHQYISDTWNASCISLYSTLLFNAIHTVNTGRLVYIVHKNVFLNIFTFITLDTASGCACVLLSILLIDSALTFFSKRYLQNVSCSWEE